VRAYVNAKFYPVDAPPVNEGIMLVDDGKIADIGEDIEIPSAADIVDLTGKVVLPGFVDAHSHAGIWGDGEGRAAYDGNERSGPITAEVSALDAVNPHQQSFESCRQGGITSVQILPGSGNVICGVGLVCKTHGQIADDMVMRFPSGLKGALGENPKGSKPKTRMGTAALIREYFARATEYMQKTEESDDDGPDTDFGLENACRVLRSEIPFRVHAHRHDDIATAVRLCEELDVPYTVEHCTDGHMIADFLGSRGATVHLGPGLSSRGKVETFNRNPANPAILHEAGARISLMTDHPFLHARHLMAYAGVAHKYGLPLEATLRALTLNPAESLGVADRVGSLTAGKDADFLVLAGEPFSYRSPVLATFVEGEEVYTRPDHQR